MGTFKKANKKKHINNLFEKIYNNALENIIIQSKKTYKKLFDINYDDILLLIKN